MFGVMTDVCENYQGRVSSMTSWLRGTGQDIMQECLLHLKSLQSDAVNMQSGTERPHFHTHAHAYIHVPKKSCIKDEWATVLSCCARYILPS